MRPVCYGNSKGRSALPSAGARRLSDGSGSLAAADAPGAAFDDRRPARRANAPGTFDGDEDMPLLWYLRDDLRLTGTRFGCGAGLCGACTVHLDGTAVRACQTPLKTLQNKRVVTIEGLSPDGTHPVQKAWVSHDVAQCGYCQTGQIMQAASLLARTPNPTDQDIDRVMTGNICRCGTYQRIRAAIKTAAKERS